MVLGKIIVAMTMEGGIGKDGGIPWRIPEDMKFFKQETQLAPVDKKNAVIMGRHTWNSLNCRPLPNRLNIIVSMSLCDHQADTRVVFVPDFAAAIEIVEKAADEIHAVYAIGGTQIYRSALSHPLFTKLLVTKIIKPDYECDTFFPCTFASECGWQLNLAEHLETQTMTDNAVEISINEITLSKSK